MINNQKTNWFGLPIHEGFSAKCIDNSSVPDGTSNWGVWFEGTDGGCFAYDADDRRYVESDSMSRCEAESIALELNRHRISRKWFTMREVNGDLVGRIADRWMNWTDSSYR